MSEKKTYKPQVSVRLNLLFFGVFILFSALILRLGVVQIVQGEEFSEQLDREINVTERIEAPRGLMYDRFGNLLVDNELQFTVTYTNRNTPQDEMIETANRLSQFVTFDTDDIEGRFDRDRREYWALLNEEEYLEKLSIEEAESQGLSDSEAHLERLNAITDEELNSFTDDELEVFLIWREFNSGYNNSAHKVQRGISYDSAAQIMENIDQMPGVDIIRDSVRSYTYGDTLSSIFGRVGSISRDDLQARLAEGYERNEEVGQSYLEAQYESVLRGRDGRLENFTDQDGNRLRNPEERQGSRGNDLVLSFDMELQQRLSNIVDSEVSRSSGRFVGEPDAYVVMMEPDTGEVLAMSGYNSDLGTFTQGYVVGSSMKGATVLAGFDTGVLAPGNTVFDRPVNFPGSNPIRSVSNLGYVDDIAALERSSNIYMIEVAMRLVNYVPGVSGTNWGNFSRGFDILRSYYQQFGLGVETGIDLPGEFTGVNGGNTNLPGQMLFLTFGQFDTYTPMQLAQYVATIANNGTRIAPKVVKEIREPGENKEELGPIAVQNEPKLLNTIDVNQTYFDRVQRGFYQVIHGSRGTARAFFNGRDYDPAGKTGTAQVSVNGQEANNQTFVGYAPFNNPEVAISVVVPGVRDNQDSSGIANRIAEASLDAYFELQDERQGPTQPESGPAVDEVGDDISD
ncbi:penicillin-binding protein 2 [Paenalkalicoccus suaedae]|uniref:serine-type D-Ala-D-Ala carboxypeptidase n=1 Tax=Paenalkalicoccus suaedae TaxID=2592382 RepID=A0A859FDI8_9BACI|nr:penicillin-binding transpeptidase domain-containing protein [Paenalkalicoccus suaedae]QKS70908.1 penicillin-binding protein 2 [Paenalkalicoccus suaedae]